MNPWTTLCMTAAAGLLLAGCGGGAAGDEDAAREAAEEQADALAAQDFGAVYDMWFDEARDLISRDDYIEWAKRCDIGGVPLDVNEVRLESDTEAVVRLGLGDFQQTYEMVVEDDEWAWVPSDEGMERARQGVEADCP